HRSRSVRPAKRLERVRVSVFPGWPHLGDIHSLVGERFGTIVNDNQETEGHHHQAEEPKHKAIMVWTCSATNYSCCSSAPLSSPSGPARSLQTRSCSAYHKTVRTATTPGRYRLHRSPKNHSWGRTRGRTRYVSELS